MKLIIDIPDTAYEGIMNADKASGNWNDNLLGILCKGVANGTPLDTHDKEIIATTVESIWGKPPYTELLDKIKAEIEQLHYHPKLDFVKNDEVVEMAIEIIDKHIGERSEE